MFIANDTKAGLAAKAKALLDAMQGLGLHDCLVHFAVQNPDGEPDRDAVSITAVRGPANREKMFECIIQFFAENEE